MLDVTGPEGTEAVIESLMEDPNALVDAQRTIDDSLAQLEVREMEERLAEIDRLIIGRKGEPWRPGGE